MVYVSKVWVIDEAYKVYLLESSFESRIPSILLPLLNFYRAVIFDFG